MALSKLNRKASHGSGGKRMAAKLLSGTKKGPRAASKPFMPVTRSTSRTSL